MLPTGLENRQTVFSWLNVFLRDKGLQFSRSGFKGGSSIGNHSVDEAAGFWGNPQYSASKPPRWLFQIDVSGTNPAALIPGGSDEIGIGASNTAQGDKAGLAVRILPLVRLKEGHFTRVDDFEINALFVFHGPLLAGSSSDAISFNVSSGTLKRTGSEESYIFAALLGLRSPNDVIQVEGGGVTLEITYGQILDAVGSAINVRLKGEAPHPIPVYDLNDDAQAEKLKLDLSKAWEDAGPLPLPQGAPSAGLEEADALEASDFAKIEVPENTGLLGIDPAVYRQINALLASGKQHLMLYGPPGTGKTSLARWIASSLPGGEWTLVTGSSDWSSQDIIGGYQPVGGGEVDFVPGILLQAFDRPLIIDEMNRCDIDKVLGPLFTVLAGHQTTLPYRTDLSDKASQPYVILPNPKASAAPHEFAPGPAWRLIATINSIDKASLYQMSFALSRRFGWVYVDVPHDLRGFISDYLAVIDPNLPQPDVSAPCPLADIWQAINVAREVGPAPIIDAINAIREMIPGANFFAPADEEMRTGLIDTVDMLLLPILDGIVSEEARKIADAIVAACSLTGADAGRVIRRLETVAL